MDPLGKKGEKALEGVENVSHRLERLESHLEAVDSALQDFMDNSRQYLRDEQQFNRSEVESIENVIEKTEIEDEKIEKLEERIDLLESREKELSRKIDSLVDSKIVGAIQHATATIDQLNRSSRKLRHDLSSLEEEVNELENEWIVEANKREYEFNQKLDAEEFESEKAKMWEEIKKLRASVHVLAEELDKKDEIEVD